MARQAALPAVRDAAFEPSCSEPSQDAGWPEFSTLSALRAATSWSTYFMSIYGSLPPETDFPVCTCDFWHIDKTRFDASGITWPRPVSSRLQRSYDDRTLHGHKTVIWQDGEFYEKLTRFPVGYYHKQWAVYHSFRPYSKSNTWIEVSHRAKGAGITGGPGSGMWFSYARGSGVWFWTGSHRLFDSHRHAAQVLCPGWGQRRYPWLRMKYIEVAMTKCARDAGLDSLSFRTSRPDPPNVTCVLDKEACKQHVSTNGTMSTWGSVGLYELMSVHLVGEHACGNVSSGIVPGIRAGWKASRPCQCESSNSDGWLNCNSAVARDIDESKHYHKARPPEKA